MVSAPAQRLFDELQRRHLPVGDDDTIVVGFFDAEGDGDLDLFLGNRLQDRLCLNDGTGIFSDAPAGRLPRNLRITTAVAAGDVDGDGDLDLVVGCSDGKRLWLNDGAGTYSDAPAGHLPPDHDTVSSLGLGDLDGDGDLDLMAAHQNFGTQGIRVYSNAGTGIFTAVTGGYLQFVHWPVSSALLLDVDADRDLDIVSGDGSGQLFLNDGGSVFTNVTWSHIPFSLVASDDLAAGDVDMDGDPDLVLRGYEPLLYINDGDGVFKVADADRLPNTNGSASSIGLGDVDGDGDADLVVSRFWGSWMARNDGTGIFTLEPHALPPDADRTLGLAFADVDGDADLDLVFANRDQDRLSLNDGFGAFTGATSWVFGSEITTTQGMAAGDVDGDGDVDLVFGNSAEHPQQTTLWLNDGGESFCDATAAHMPALLERTTSVALGDVDEDDDLDLVLGASSGGGSLYLNDGAGSFTDATEPRLETDDDYTEVIAMGDVDGDGDLDILMGNRGTDRLHLNDGFGVFQDETSARLPRRNPPATVAAALADFDRDGDLDIVRATLGRFGRQIEFWQNDGSGTFADVSATHTPADVEAATAMAVGDVDGDADLDLVVGTTHPRSWTGAEIRVYRNDGTGHFLVATSPPMPSIVGDRVMLALGDLDDDGDLDLLSCSYGSRTGVSNSLWSNDGSGTFTDATATPLAGVDISGSQWLLADLDSDGDPDLVAANGERPKRLFRNLTRQLHAPFLLRAGRDYVLEVHSHSFSPSAAELVMPFVSFASASVPLPPLGTLRIDPALAIPLPPFLIPPASDVGSARIRIPAQSTLVGIAIHSQAVLLPYPRPPRLTNAVRDVVIR